MADNEDMKLIIPVIIAFTGCAHTWVDQTMQPDRTYKIVVDGNSFTSLEKTKIAANQRAASLCPAGYDKKAEVPEDGDKPTYILIVKCR